jgi:hypothetical protein
MMLILNRVSRVLDCTVQLKLFEFFCFTLTSTREQNARHIFHISRSSKHVTNGFSDEVGSIESAF